MNEITYQQITFKQLEIGNFTLADDCFGIASYVFTPSRIAASIHCPFNTSKNNTAFFLINVNGIVAARSQLLGTRFYANGEIFPCQTGSSLESAKKFRNQGIGAEVMLYSVKNKEYNFRISSGISIIALPLYKKLKYNILEFPRIMQLRRSRCILESKGLRGGLLKFTSILVDIPIKALVAYSKFHGLKLKRKFTIEKVKIVPEWVDNIVLDDKYKYMEVHDRKWLQWNLDYNFTGKKQDIQSFYIIKKDDEPIGFFMTKERFRELAGGILKNIVLAAIVEWGTMNDNILSETDIYDIALTTFGNNVDILETATSNQDVVKKMKKRFFIPHGFAHIAFKDKKKQFNNTDDINLWRIRYGYADVILT